MVIETPSIQPKDAKRGQIWKVNLDPTIGSEIKKKRRVLIVSANELKSVKVKLAVPITDWKTWHESAIWCVPIEPSIQNGLRKKSTADVLQTRCLSTERFLEYKGLVSAELLEEIVAALAAIVEYV